MPSLTDEDSTMLSVLLQCLDSFDGGLEVADSHPATDSGQTILVPYSTDYQRRRRNEIQALRTQVQQLANQLKSLLQQRRKIIRQTHLHASKRSWRSSAMVEHEKRLQSERSNREMKAAISKQLHFLESVRSVLHKYQAFEAVDFVGRLQPTADRQLFQVDYSDSLFAELSNYLDQQHQQLTALSVDESTADVVLRSHQQENYFETKVVTRLACSGSRVGDIILRYATTDRTISQKAFQMVRRIFFNKVLLPAQP